MTKLALSLACVGALAATCHSANAAYCRQLGDDSQPAWDDLPEPLRLSAEQGVQFTLDNPDGTPAEQHQSWLKGKEADGWTFGKVKDAEKKTHPCMVPYDQLPATQQFKDALFRSIVLGLAPSLALYDHATTQSQEVLDRLKPIPHKLFELGLATNGDDFDVAAVTCSALDKGKADAAALVLALAAADKAKRVASASAGRAAGKARKISAKDVVDPIVGSGEGDEALTREQALLLAIGEAESVEVVLSNGKTELTGVPPIALHGDAWRVTMVGVQLTLAELIVHGPAPGQSAYALNGYGLLLDGVLRAYSARGEQLNIAGGSNNNVAPDIVF